MKLAYSSKRKGLTSSITTKSSTSIKKIREKKAKKREGTMKIEKKEDKEPSKKKSTEIKPEKKEERNVGQKKDKTDIIESGTVAKVVKGPEKEICKEK